MSHPEDIFVWSDGTWIYRYEVTELLIITDDYNILFYGSEDHEAFCASFV